MALNDTTIVNRGSTNHPHLQWGCDQLLSGDTINPRRLCTLASDGTLSESAVGDLASAVLGVMDRAVALASGARVPLARGYTAGVADDALTPGWAYKVGLAGRILRFLDSAAAAATMKTTGNGEAFTNQPANDGIEIVSSNAGDTTQTITIIGTTTGTDTVVVETKTLNGTTPVSFTKVDWGQVLAWKKSAATLGTITIREASADQTIATSTASDLSGGVETVSAGNQQAYNVAPTIEGSGATTKQVGVQGTDSTGATIYDSQALNGTTPVTMNSAFKRVTEVYTGDLESNRTATLKTGAAEAEGLRCGTVLTVATAQGDTVGILHGT